MKLSFIVLLIKIYKERFGEHMIRNSLQIYKKTETKNMRNLDANINKIM